MKEKEFKIKFVDNSLNEDLKKLKKGKTSEKELYELIIKAIKHIKEDPIDSINIKKRQIPKTYIKNTKLTILG